MADSKRLGGAGEWLAYRFLVENGLDVLSKNWRAPFGEINLVARGTDACFFVEVKTRRRDIHFQPEDSVTQAKRDRYRRLAAYFRKQYDLGQLSLQFRIIAIEVDDQGVADVRWLPMFPTI